jgi:His/Glu/Gln/Arg/opine family amino acid ABC transporter permease subunit
VRIDLGILRPYVGFLAEGALLTAQVCALALIAGVVLGMIVAIARTSQLRWVQWLAFAYVDLFRNIPFIVQLFFFYYGLPEIGIYIDAFTTGVIALSIAGGAYASDAILRIVLPIALRTSVRPLGSVLINMILTSSILSTITLNELTGNARIVTSETFRPFEVYVVLLVVYAALTYLVSIGVTLLHRWLNRDLQEQVR